MKHIMARYDKICSLMSTSLLPALTGRENIMIALNRPGPENVCIKLKLELFAGTHQAPALKGRIEAAG